MKFNFLEGRIRIAIVGCGRISRNHIKAIALHHNRAELVALCDTEQERLDTAQELVAELVEENPEVAQNPVQFVGRNLLRLKSNSLDVDLVVLPRQVACILPKPLQLQSWITCVH